VLCQDDVNKPSAAAVPNLPDGNPQLLHFAIQDQSDRGDDLFSGKQLKTPQNLNVPKRDAERQAKVWALLAEGKVNTGRDYYFAALIFQHSETSENLLLAHILAVTSIAKGDKSGGWLSAATLDRYLWSRYLVPNTRRARTRRKRWSPMTELRFPTRFAPRGEWTR
jgi:hypothetical protein